MVLCAALAAGALWVVYRLRMAQVAQRVRTLLEERLGERERIARELHDTLLQSVQGLILRFQAVTDRLPQEEPARRQLEATLKRADDVMIEGRNRVRDLRLSEESGDLRGLIEKLVENAGFDPPIPIRIVVEGQPRPVDTLVAAEIGRIAAEALLNVARHARATAVEIEIGFHRHELGLRIHDNGVGLDADVLSKGEKEGHFGLVGMRERAARIGGTLTIESGAGLGTDLTLTTRRGWPSRNRFAAAGAGS
jgi:signal transduction histidine kinase